MKGKRMAPRAFFNFPGFSLLILISVCVRLFRVNLINMDVLNMEMYQIAWWNIIKNPASTTKVYKLIDPDITFSVLMIHSGYEPYIDSHMQHCESDLPVQKRQFTWFEPLINFSDTMISQSTHENFCNGGRLQIHIDAWK